MKNPYNDYTNKELCDIIQDIYESRSNGKRVESFVPYARELKDNINGSSEIITLRETLEMRNKIFMMLFVIDLWKLFLVRKMKIELVFHLGKEG